MFLYVFSEEDRQKMEAAGFAFICMDKGVNAWIFEDAGAKHSVPEGVAVYRSSRMTFTKGGGRNGTENDSAL